MQNNSFNLRIPFEHPFVKKKRNRQNTESLIYYLYVHDCTLASECIWVSSPRTRLRNTAGQAMLIRGSEWSLINMSRPDILCHDNGMNLETNHQIQNKIISKNSNFAKSQLHCNFPKAFYYKCNPFTVLLF